MGPTPLLVPAAEDVLQGTGLVQRGSQAADLRDLGPPNPGTEWQGMV
jgi:hypothetical protein